MKFRNLIILAVVCYAAPTLAQDAKKDSTTLKKELTLEKEYTPTIRDAAKINALPELKEPEAPKTSVEFAKFSVPYEIAPQLITLPSGSYFTDVPHSKKRGYLKAGVSSFVDINADLGYQILNTEKNRLSIFGSHRSSNGNVKYLQNDEKQKMKINDNLFGLNFLHDLGGIRLNVDAKYINSSFNYYGITIPGYDYYAMPILAYHSSSYYHDDYYDIHSYPVYVVDKDINQNNNFFEISAGVINDRPNELNYSFNLSNIMFKQKYLYLDDSDGVKENRFMADWDVHNNVTSSMHIGLGGYWKNYSAATPKGEIVLNYYDYNNISLNPYLGFEGDNWDLRLGVKVNMLLMSEVDNEHNFAPNIRLNFRPSERLNLYVVADGGVTDNGGYSMFHENRYVAPANRVLDSRSPLDGKIGIQGSPTDNLWFDVFAGYKITNDEHFFLTSRQLRFRNPAALYTPSSSETFLVGGAIIPVYHDAKVFSIGGNIKYNFQEQFELGLKATYYSWNLSSDVSHPEYGILLTELNKPWNKPNLVAELSATYRLSQLPLRLDAVYRMETGRETFGIVGVENMKNINNLGATGTYKINETISVYAKVNNLLFQKYDLFYGYPAQNFSIMGGLSILF